MYVCMYVYIYIYIYIYTHTYNYTQTKRNTSSRGAFAGLRERYYVCVYIHDMYICDINKNNNKHNN